MGNDERSSDSSELRALVENSTAPDADNFKTVPDYGKLASDTAKVLGVLIIVLGGILAVSAIFSKVS